MAGNTKMLGFGPDSSGQGIIKLSRWGKETTVKVSRDTIKGLQEACASRLPSKPDVSTQAGPEFRSRYDPVYGRVEVSMTPATAEFISSLLDHLAKFNVTEGKDHLQLNSFSESLISSAGEHEEYLNATGEPGVDNTD